MQISSCTCFFFLKWSEYALVRSSSKPFFENIFCHLYCLFLEEKARENKSIKIGWEEFEIWWNRPFIFSWCEIFLLVFLRARCPGSKVWSGVSTSARRLLRTRWCVSVSRTESGSDPCWPCRPEQSAVCPAASASWWSTARSRVRKSHGACLDSNRSFRLMPGSFCSSGVRSMHSTDIQWSAILSWGYADNILRLKSKQSEPPINFIQCSQLHQVNKSSE